MSNRPFKNAAWSQGLYEVSSTKKEVLGALRITEDGRRFRYGKAGGTLLAGAATFMAAAVANHIAQVQTGYTNPLGATNVQVLVGATAVTTDQYEDGYLVMYRGAAGTAGLYYSIDNHQVSAAGSEVIRVTLKEPIIKATVATDYFSLFANPWASMIAATDNAVSYGGQAFVGMTSGQYGWFQTGGFGVCMNEGTPAVGSLLIPSDTTSELEIGTAFTSPLVGWIHGIAGVAGYYTPVILVVD